MKLNNLLSIQASLATISVSKWPEIIEQTTDNNENMFENLLYFSFTI